MAVVQEPVAARAVPPWRQKLAAFWRWWTGELVHLLPERFAQLGGRTRLPVIEMAGDELILVEPKSAVGPQTRVSIAALDEAQRRQALRALLERAGEQRQRVRVCLCHDEALVRRVTMPAATEENLSQVLAFEMDRLTPFRAEDVYFDYRVVSREAAAGQIGVQLAVARRERVDAQVAKMRALGASVQGVTVREGAGSAGFDLDLLPSEQRGERESSRERLIHRVLAAAVVALAVIALLFPVWEKRQAVLTLHPIVAKGKQEAEATDAIARELERQVSDYNFLLGKKQGTYPALAFLEEVSRLFPDNTWVQQLDVKSTGKAREVTTSGETVSSSKLIELLEQSPILQNAAPRGSVVRGSVPGTERFVISAEARPRAPVEASPVLESAAAPQATKNPAAAPPR
jgi:general secretion pathway protein L